MVQKAFESDDEDSRTTTTAGSMNKPGRPPILPDGRPDDGRMRLNMADRVPTRALLHSG